MKGRRDDVGWCLKSDCLSTLYLFLMDDDMSEQTAWRSSCHHNQQLLLLQLSYWATAPLNHVPQQTLSPLSSFLLDMAVMLTCITKCFNIFIFPSHWDWQTLKMILTKL